MATAIRRRFNPKKYGGVRNQRVEEPIPPMRDHRLKLLPL
jgi:hypothetical protein